MITLTRPIIIDCHLGNYSRDFFPPPLIHVLKFLLLVSTDKNVQGLLSMAIQREPQNIDHCLLAEIKQYKWFYPFIT